MAEILNGPIASRLADAAEDCFGSLPDVVHTVSVNYHGRYVYELHRARQDAQANGTRAKPLAATARKVAAGVAKLMGLGSHALRPSYTFQLRQAATIQGQNVGNWVTGIRSRHGNIPAYVQVADGQYYYADDSLRTMARAAVNILADGIAYTVADAESLIAASVFGPEAEIIFGAVERILHAQGISPTELSLPEPLPGAMATPTSLYHGLLQRDFPYSSWPLHTLAIRAHRINAATIQTTGTFTFANAQMPLTVQAQAHYTGAGRGMPVANFNQILQPDGAVHPMALDYAARMAVENAIDVQASPENITRTPRPATPGR